METIIPNTDGSVIIVLLLVYYIYMAVVTISDYCFNKNGQSDGIATVADLLRPPIFTYKIQLVRLMMLRTLKSTTPVTKTHLSNNNCTEGMTEMILYGFMASR